MLYFYFKQTMDRFGVKGKDLAEAFGCRQNYISEIRMGKCNPPINRFWELLETMNKLAPGAKEYFGKLIASSQGDFFIQDLVETINPADLVAAMDDEQLSQFMFAVAARIGSKVKQSKSNKKSEELAAVA